VLFVKKAFETSLGFAVKAFVMTNGAAVTNRNKHTSFQHEG